LAAVFVSGSVRRHRPCSGLLRKVLTIDDSKVVRSMVTKRLADYDCEVVGARELGISGYVVKPFEKSTVSGRS
jgi:hypothetical protein